MATMSPSHWPQEDRCGGSREKDRKGHDKCHSSRSVQLGAVEKGTANSSAEDSHHLSPFGTSRHTLRRCRSASPLSRAPLFSPEQCRLMRKSWQRVGKQAIGRAIYEHLIARCSDAKSVFLSDYSTIQRHEKYFCDLIQSSMDNLLDLEEALQPWLEMIGRGHKFEKAQFDIKAYHWDAFGEAMTSALSAWIGPGKYHKETVRAWRILFSFISDRLGSYLRQRTTASTWSTPRIQLLTLVNDGPFMKASTDRPESRPSSRAGTPTGGCSTRFMDMAPHSPYFS